MTLHWLTIVCIIVGITVLIVMAYQYRQETLEINGFRKKAEECFAAMQEVRTEEKTSLWLEAQAYHREIDNRYEERRSRRDLILELFIILLIGLELRDAGQQGRILDQMKVSMSDTATAMKTLVQDQKDSLSAQVASLQNIKDMNSVVAQQLEFLKGEQAERLAQESRRPIFKMWGESFDPSKGSHSVLLGERASTSGRIVGATREYSIDPTHTYSRYILRNVGNAPAYNVKITTVLPTGITLRCIEFPYLRISSYEPNPGPTPECSSPYTTIPPIQPRPKDRTYADSKDSVLDHAFDTDIQISLTVPTTAKQFLMQIVVDADQMRSPTIFNVYYYLVN